MKSILSRVTGVAALAAALVASTVAIAQVESLTFTQMLERADSAIAGVVVKKTTWAGRLDGVPSPLDFTTITVQGEDWYSGRQATREITYLGSEAQPVSEMPVENETAVGTRALYFSTAMAGSWGGREHLNSLVAAQNGVFRIESGPKGDVVIGKNKGAAVESNTFLKDLRAQASTELAAIRARRQK